MGETKGEELFRKGQQAFHEQNFVFVSKCYIINIFIKGFKTFGRKLNTL